MSKAEQIRQLHKKGWSTREIAEEVGCRPEYVRVAARQRTEGGLSAIDKRYIIGRFGSMKAYQDDLNARTRDYRLAYYAKRWREDPEYRKANYLSKARARVRRRQAKLERAQP